MSVPCLSLLICSMGYCWDLGAAGMRWHLGEEWLYIGARRDAGACPRGGHVCMVGCSDELLHLCVS